MTRQQNRANVESHDELKLGKSKSDRKTCSLWELEGNVPPNKHAKRRKKIVHKAATKRETSKHIYFYSAWCP